jgi:endogenous inhibitor of DNA gyrase (YacG/DUF329 family)
MRVGYDGSKNPNWKGGYPDKCTQCGTKIWIKPSRAHKTRHFCSKECSFKWQSENIRGEKTSGWKGGQIQKTCSLCGTAFYIQKSQAQRGEGKYCGRECFSKSRVTSIESKCKYCGKKIVVEKNQIGDKSFCSYECKSKSQIKRLSVKCIICGRATEKPLAQYMRNATKRFVCSKECFSTLMSGSSNPSWRNGKSFEPYTASFTEALKEYIRNRDDGRCMVCYIKHEDGKKKFPVHHVDYDKSNCDVLNLITLCPSCHGKTTKDRQIWIQFFKQVIETLYGNSARKAM